MMNLKLQTCCCACFMDFLKPAMHFLIDSTSSRQPLVSIPFYHSERNQSADALNWPQWTFSHYFLDLWLAVIFSCCSEFVFLFEFKEAQISDGWPTQIFSTQEAAKLQIYHLRSISVGLLFVLWVWFLSFPDNRACESSAFCSQLKKGGAFLRLIIWCKFQVSERSF